MAELHVRKQSILRAIIVEYVSGAEPVGSEQLVQKYDLGVRSATVRNEMAELADLGYLEQPHTSAGRVPSDLGYRYYVDRLEVNDSLNENFKQKVKSVTEQSEALQRVLRDTAKALSRLTHLFSVATTVRHQEVTVRNALLSALGPNQALLVLILSNGHVENKMIECPPGLTLEDIGRLNEQLNLNVTGKTLRPLTKLKHPVHGVSSLAWDRLANTVYSAIRVLSRELTRGVLITEGEEFMYAQPEFQRDLASLSGLLDYLVDSDVLYESVTQTEHLQFVTIGKENKHEEMRRFSIVRHAYYVGEKEAGVIALVGPTRMSYEQSIPIVNFTARALSQSLTKLFG
jgi:heat-inducible transcriptional repressor